MECNLEHMHHKIKRGKIKQLVGDVADIPIGPQPSTFPEPMMTLSKSIIKLWVEGETN
jgi:hypothetical protein